MEHSDCCTLGAVGYAADKRAKQCPDKFLYNFPRMAALFEWDLSCFDARKAALNEVVPGEARQGKAIFLFAGL